MTDLQIKMKEKVEHYFDVSLHEIITKYIFYVLETRGVNHTNYSILALRRMFGNATWNDFNWEMYVKCCGMSKIYQEQDGFNTITKFLLFALDNNLYDKPDIYEILEIKEILQKMLAAPIKDISNKWVEGINTWNIILYKEEKDKRRVCTDRFALCPHINREIARIINDYYNKPNEIYNFRIKEWYDTEYFMSFHKSLEGKFKVERLEDFNEEVFLQQLHYFYNDYGWTSARKLGFILKFHIYIQYIMGEEMAKQKYPTYDIDTLKYNTLISKILIEDYKVVKYSIHDKPKYYPRVIVKPNNMELTGTLSSDSIFAFDFSVINNDFLQHLFFDFFWEYAILNMATKREAFYYVRDFLKFMVDTSEVEISKENFEITAQLLTSYRKNRIDSGIDTANIAKAFAGVRKFFNYIENKNIIKIDTLMYKLLTSQTPAETKGYKESFTKEEIEQIIDAMKQEILAQDNPHKATQYQLYLYAFTIYSISDIRISSILALDKDCVKTTLTRKGGSEYKVVASSKASGTGLEEYNITRYVKSIIDEVIEYTERFRKDAPSTIKNKLFICQTQYRSGLSQLKQSTFTEYFERILSKYNIRKLRLAAVRNYYMQNVSNYVFSNNYDVSLIEKLTNHSIQVHVNHYDDVDIMTFCQNFYKVEIGNVYLKGKIEDSNELPREQTVGNGCGHCSQSKCVLLGKLDCFMCQHFVTTLEHIPFYKQEIEKIDKLIEAQTIPHEQEFLVSKKKLLVAYLEKLLEREAQKNDK